MANLVDATCSNCGKDVSVRPCPHCGGNIINFDRKILEPHIQVNDIVQRTHEGNRSKYDYYAILIWIVITSFEIFVVLKTSTPTIITIHLFLAFLNVLAGYYAIVRHEDKLILRLRKAFGTSNIQPTTVNKTRRICDICKTPFNDYPCPKCGNHSATIIGVINEIEAIKENLGVIKKRNFTKVNYLGIGFSIALLGIQLSLSYFNGSVIDLVISMLFGMITFIPSYYAFLEIKFKDTEVII